MASIARFAGRCLCGERVAAGAPITGERRDGRFVIVGCAVCAPDRHQAPAPASRLRVRVTRIMFERPDHAFTIARTEVVEVVESADGRLTPSTVLGVKGRLPHPLRVGDILEVYGSASSGQYGLELQAQSAVPVVAATDQALRAFLARLPQVGPRRAEQLLQALGGRKAVVEALEHHPERLTVVAGITLERAEAMARAYNESSAIRDSAMFLAELDLGEALTAAILDEWGADARTILLDDPYVLMQLRGVGFVRADEIARTKLRIADDDPRRLAAAVLDLMEQAEREGHTFATVEDLAALSK